MKDVADADLELRNDCGTLFVLGLVPLRLAQRLIQLKLEILREGRRWARV